MNKHTPGPWRYGIASNYCGFYVAPENCSPTLAAVERPVGSGHTTNVMVHNFPGETEANARLISKSPELFEKIIAIQSIASSAESSEDFIFKFGVWMKSCREIIDSIELGEATS